MDLINQTPLPSALLPSGNGKDEVLLLALTSMTVVIGAEEARLAEEQLPLRLQADPPLSNDAQHLRDCVSVCVSGFAYPDSSGKRGQVTLVVGAARIGIAVFGPRVWEASGIHSVKPSPPLSFDCVAMTWDNAFGGSVHEPATELENDGETYVVPDFDRHYAPNPQGVGFARDAASAVGKPLPQLEHPDQLLSSWEDAPEPVCFAPYPLFGSLRAQGLIADGKVDLDRMGRLPALSAPRTTFPKIVPGTRMILEGMRRNGEILSLTLPPPPVRYEVEVGGLRRTVVPYLDTVEIDAERSAARLVYRAGFRYPLIGGERRSLAVHAGSGFPDVSPRPPGEA